MKISGTKQSLSAAIASVSRCVSSRSALPVLAGVRITAVEGTHPLVTLDATDLEQFVSIAAEGIGVHEPGVAVLPAALLGNMLKSLPAGDVTLEAKPGERAFLRSGSVEFSLTSYPADDFPQVPDMPQGKTSRVDADLLADALSQVVRAASPDAGRPVLTGVSWKIEGDNLTLAATDSYRLAVRSIPVQGATDADAIVPSRALAELKHHLSGGRVSVWLGETQAGFRVGRMSMITRLIEGKFPDYKQLIPTSYPATLTADRVALKEAITRMGLVAQANTPVKVSVGDRGTSLSASQTGVADASESLEGVTYDGDEMLIGFNPRFLADGLDAIVGDKVTIQMVDPGRPALMAGEGNYRHLVMPVRLWS